MNIETLIALANKLDEEGFQKDADDVDEIIRSVAGWITPEEDPEFFSQIAEERKSEMKKMLEREEITKEQFDKWLERGGNVPEKIWMGEKTKIIPTMAERVGEETIEDIMRMKEIRKHEPDVKGPRSKGVEIKKKPVVEIIPPLGEEHDIPGVDKTPEPVIEEESGKAEMQKNMEEEARRWAESLGLTLNEGERADDALANKEYIFEKLSSIADGLDKVGAIEEADLIDGFIQKHAERKSGDGEQGKQYDSKYHRSLQVREPKTKKEKVDREGGEQHQVKEFDPIGGSLSTRYCPDHIGDMLGRVGENTYQCPRDGKIYNRELGYTDYEGTKVPGGSVAGQTPESTGYFATPHRLFDSREQILRQNIK